MTHNLSHEAILVGVGVLVLAFVFFGIIGYMAEIVRRRRP